MNRLFCLSALILGLCLPVYFGRFPSPATLLFIVVCAFALLFMTRSVAPLLLVLGMMLRLFQLYARINSQLDESLQGQDFRVRAYIQSATSDGEYQRFIAELSCENGDASCVPLEGMHTRLSWKTQHIVRSGETWDLLLRLKTPRGFANAGGFDYQLWLLSQNLHASGYVRFSPENRQLLHAKGMNFQMLRQRLDATLIEVCENCKRLAYLRALLLGEKQGISAEEWQLLQHTGTIHLMAISGLHIGLIASLGFFLARLLSRLFFTHSARWALLYFPALLSISFASIYAVLANFSIPTQRALIVVVLLNLALVVTRKVSVFWLLGIAAVLVVMLDPFAPRQTGFVLSFLAVAILLLSFSYRPRKRNRFIAFIKAQWVLLLGLALPMLLLNLPSALTAPIANAIAVPVVSLVVLPLLFLSAFLALIFPSLAALLLKLCDLTLDAVLLYLEKVESFKALAYFTQLNSSLCLVFAAGLVILLLLPKGLGFRLAGSCALIALLFVEPDHSRSRMTVLDVGQGLAISLEVGDSLFVYDTGARFSDSFDIGSRVLGPFLRQNNWREVDALVLSHSDNDHAGGFEGLASMLKINRLFAGEPDKISSTNALSCRSLSQTAVSSTLPYDIEVLWPLPPDPNTQSANTDNKPKLKTNNQSCVLLLNINGYTILLTGDIERSVEKSLLRHGRLPGNVDILIAPHHGSNSSSSRAFIEQVNPKHVVFSAGYRNRYRHPASKVQSRYRDAGSMLWNTASQGAITFHLDAGDLRVENERCRSPRLWWPSDDCTRK